MKQSTIKYLRNELDFEKDDIKEVRLSAIKHDDFEVNDYRFIEDSVISDIHEDEIGSDLYTLGMFNADFLSGVTNIPYKVFKALQSAEAWEEIGEMVEEFVPEIAEEYARLDGYGHHFAHYDGHGHEVDDWHIFRVN